MIPQQGIPQRRRNSEKCKIVVRRIGNKVEKSIQGNCTKEQLRALSDLPDEPTTE